MIKCFLVRPTSRYRQSLRRYSNDQRDCPGKMGYHDAHFDLGISEQPGYSYESARPANSDPRWPAKCDSCEFHFAESDEYQLFEEHIYVDDGGVEHTLRDRTPGMMWEMPWLHDPLTDEPVVIDSAARTMLSPYYYRDWQLKRAPICVVCPNGAEWIVDQRANNGEGWEVRGEAPTLACSPSIVVPGYHGWLGTNGAQPGYFTDDIEGRGPNGIAR